MLYRHTLIIVVIIINFNFLVYYYNGKAPRMGLKSRSRLCLLVRYYLFVPRRAKEFHLSLIISFHQPCHKVLLESNLYKMINSIIIIPARLLQIHSSERLSIASSNFLIRSGLVCKSRAYCNAVTPA